MRVALLWINRVCLAWHKKLIIVMWWVQMIQIMSSVHCNRLVGLSAVKHIYGWRWGGDKCVIAIACKDTSTKNSIRHGCKCAINLYFYDSITTIIFIPLNVRNWSSQMRCSDARYILFIDTTYTIVNQWIKSSIRSSTNNSSIVYYLFVALCSCCYDRHLCWVMLKWLE